MPSSRSDVRSSNPAEAFLDHSSLDETDLPWLRGVRTLTLWAVSVSPGLLSQLPGLEFLDLRGGSGSDLTLLDGVTELRFLKVNQIRGLTDLSQVGGLRKLIAISIYGLPKVTALPALNDLLELRRIDLGSMKGLESIDELFTAPSVEELMFIRAVRVPPDAADLIAQYRPLREFGWHSLGAVPDKTWMPLVTRVGKPSPPPSWDHLLTRVDG